MKPTYTIRQQARDDLESIWLYTLEKWGVEQADQYFHMIISRFSWLAENPKAGKARCDIHKGYYCISAGSHLIFYQLENQQPDIIRVLHQKADIVHWLEN